MKTELQWVEERMRADKVEASADNLFPLVVSDTVSARNLEMTKDYKQYCYRFQSLRL
jgi:hypothetical protein